MRGIIGVVHDGPRTAAHVGGIALPLDGAALLKRSHALRGLHRLDQPFAGNSACSGIEGGEKIVVFGNSWFIGGKFPGRFNLLMVRSFFVQRCQHSLKPLPAELSFLPGTG